jgi:hypothetical protein
MANERFDVFLPRSGDGVHECLDMLRKWSFGLILSKITFSFFFFVDGLSGTNVQKDSTTSVRASRRFGLSE